MLSDTVDWKADRQTQEYFRSSFKFDSLVVVGLVLVLDSGNPPSHTGCHGSNEHTYMIGAGCSLGTTRNRLALFSSSVDTLPLSRQTGNIPAGGVLD